MTWVPAMNWDSAKAYQLDHDDRAFRYYRNAVERHWDPGDIDISGDLQPVIEMGEEPFFRLRAAVAKFGAGEQAVTEDLAPMAVVLEDVEDQMFLTTQLYEEAKHTDFFDRYWRDVINAAEAERGDERTSPLDERWFNDAYYELFERNEDAVARLLEEDTPETRAKAFCHYHLAIEGILAQTGYYGLQTTYGPDTPELPNLPGLVEGLKQIRSDEGRHVGFGMAKLKNLVADEGIEPQFLHDTVNELLPLINGITGDAATEDAPGPGPSELNTYAAKKHTDRMQQITDVASDIPDVDELTSLSDD